MSSAPLRRNLLAFLFGLPKRPGELNTYSSALGRLAGSASLMWLTLTVISRLVMFFLNSSATAAPLPYLESW